MARETPFERSARELERAAERQVAAKPRLRPAPTVARPRFALAASCCGAGAGAAAWAATSLLSSGSPVPFTRGAPVAGQR